MEMKNCYYILLLIICTLFSCKKKKEEVHQIRYNIFYDSIPKNKKRIKTITLKPGVKKKIVTSQSFTVTSEYIDSLNIAPLSKVDDIAYILNEQLEELPEELDSILRTNGVLSRIKQIETYSRAINFEVSKNHRDTTKINEHIIKTLESFNSLIVQLNESNVKLPKNFKEELEKTNQIKKDSIEGVPLF